MAPAAINEERASSSSSQKDGLPVYSEQAAPAVHDLPPDFTERLARLDLGSPNGSGINVSPDLCIAHLKFLEAVHHLKDTIGRSEDLFSIKDPPATLSGMSKKAAIVSEADRRNLAKIRVAEKRWAVYVARAVHRFQKWWETTVPSSKQTEPRMLTVQELTMNSDIHKSGEEGIAIKTLNSRDRLPPLDVLMVWHAYMLNPRCFFEDCIRYQKLDFFATPFPFQAIDSCIDVVTFDFKGTEQAQHRFTSSTGLEWDNIQDSPTTTVQCGKCNTSTQVPWTKGSQWQSFTDEIAKGAGLADASFSALCRACLCAIDHEHLKVAKFLRDAKACYSLDVAMPGTCLNQDGVPEEVIKSSVRLGKPYNNFPNLLIKASFVQKVDLASVDPAEWSMERIRKGLEEAIADTKLVKSAKVSTWRVLPGERNAIRRMMSRYWHNHSPFALDLVGAVIRQGSFVDKMHDIDWLHSPALQGTMSRLIVKYSRFFDIIAKNPRHMAVPTLDVDLGWHTHQLNAVSYYKHSVTYAYKFIDHDDKVDEVALSTAFEWTSKKYSEMYGEPYSECRCWYCEAVRESSSSKLDGLLRPRKKEATAKLHDADDVSSDPLKSPHISAHNAVRDLDGDAEAKAQVHAAKLDKAFNKAKAKARKKGQKEPTRDEYYAAYFWGYPYMMPVYYPYAVPAVAGAGGCYPSEPCTYSSEAGAYGNCAAGTCSAMAAAGGGCASASGACGGSGGCGGGGGGGGCGGGGGGGCGGGG